MVLYSVVVNRKVTEIGSIFADTLDMEFWDRVDALREKQNTTYRWIAEKVVKKSETTVSGWRGQGVLPRANDAVAIAQALGVSVEYLVTGSDAADPWLREHTDFLRDCKVIEAAGRFAPVRLLASATASELRASTEAEAADMRNGSSA